MQDNNSSLLVQTQEELKPTVADVIEKQESYDPFQDDQYLTQGSFLLSALKKAKDSVEDRRVAMTKPLNESLREINRFFKGFSDPIEDANTKLRAKLLQHRKAIEEKRVEEQIDAIENDKPEVPDLKNKIGAVVDKKVWTFRVEDITKIPTQYLVVDEVKVRAAIRSGVREIDGVVIYQEDRISL